MTSILHAFLGPRVPQDELINHRLRYATPSALLILARVALLISLFLPFWKMDLHAPQYPDGLQVTAYVNRLTGDVAEIDGLNHYIGMRPLNEAAKLERSLSVYMVAALILLVEGAMYLHTKWAALLVAPTIFFVPFFLLDLHFWMSDFGNNLNPEAPLSHAVKPFTPPVMGTGGVGQFHTIAYPGPGMILAAFAGALVIVGLYFHRRAYKPLGKATKATRAASPANAQPATVTASS